MTVLKRSIPAFFALTLSLPAAGYEVVDRSGSDVEPGLLHSVLTNVADLFRDPESVQFRDVRLGKEDALCGEVNAKNGYGAYVGFQPFYNLRMSQTPHPPPPQVGVTVRCR